MSVAGGNARPCAGAGSSSTWARRWVAVCPYCRSAVARGLDPAPSKGPRPRSPSLLKRRRAPPRAGRKNSTATSSASPARTQLKHEAGGRLG